MIGAAAAAASLLVVWGPGFAQDLLFNENVTPEVIATAPLAREGRVSEGDVAGNGGYTVDRRNGVELGLRARLNGGDASTVQSALLAGENRYFFSAGNAPGEHGRVPTWVFDWSVNVDPDSELGRNLNALDYEIFLDGDPGPDTDFLSFGPLAAPPVGVPFDIRCLIAFGNNATGLGGGASAGPGCTTQQIVQLRNSNNVMQSSCDYDCPRLDTGPLAAFDPNAPGIYTLALEARTDGVLVARTEIEVVVDTGLLALDLTGPDSVSTAVEFYQARLRNLGDRATQENVEALFTISRTGIDVGDLVLDYCVDPNASSGPDCQAWLPLDLALVNGSLRGRFGPEGGFPVEEDYDETTFLRASFQVAGTYGIDAEIVTVPGGQLLALDRLTVLVDAGGGITGQVTVQGIGPAILPAEGAGVIARLAGNGEEVASVSSSGGTYELLGLPQGSYELTAVQSGFSSAPAEVEIEDDGLVIAGPTLELQSSVAGDFQLTAGGLAIDQQGFVAGATIENVNLSFDRTDIGSEVDFKVSLTVRDSQGIELDWTHPGSGIFAPDTLSELDGRIGTGDADEVYSIAGQSVATILDDVTLTLGDQADQMASLGFRLIDNRYLPGRIVHAATDFEVSVDSPASAELELSIDGPTVLPVTEPGIYAVSLVNDGDAATPENVKVRFTISRPGIVPGDLLVDYCEDSASEGAPGNCNWLPLNLVSDNGSLSGRFGPVDGFPVQDGYEATTLIRAVFAEAGNYAVQADVVGIDSAGSLASAAIDVAVPALAFEIEEGVSSGVDDSDLGFGYFTAELANLGEALPELVRLYVQVRDSGGEIVDDTRTFEYWDGANWEPLAWIADEARWAFGPASGFPVGEGYFAATPVRVDFPNEVYDLVVTVETADRVSDPIWIYGWFQRQISVVTEPKGTLSGTINGADANDQTLTVGDAFAFALNASEVLPRSGQDLFVVFDGQRPSDSSGQPGEAVCFDLLGADDCAEIAAGIGFANPVGAGNAALFDGEVSIRGDAETGVWILSFYLVEALDDGDSGSIPGQVVDTLSVELTVEPATVALNGLGTSTLRVDFSTDVVLVGTDQTPADVAAQAVDAAGKQAFLDAYFEIRVSQDGVPTPIPAAGLDAFGTDWERVLIEGGERSLSVTFEAGVINLNFALDRGNTGATRIDVEWIGTDAFETVAGGQSLSGPDAENNPFKVEFDVDYSLATGPDYGPATATFIDRSTPLQRPFLTGIQFGGVSRAPVSLEFAEGVSAVASLDGGVDEPYSSGDPLTVAGSYRIVATNDSNPGIESGSQTAVEFTMVDPVGTLVVTADGQALDGQRIVRGDRRELGIAVEDLAAPPGAQLAVVFDGFAPGDASAQDGNLLCAQLLDAADCADLASILSPANPFAEDRVLFDRDVSVLETAAVGDWILRFFLVEVLAGEIVATVERLDAVITVEDPVDLVLSIEGPTQLEPGDPGFYAVNLRNVGPGQGDENVTLEYLIERRGLAEGDVVIEFCADGAAEAEDCNDWVALTPAQDGEGRLAGRFGPAEGFPTPAGYDETTRLRVRFERVGPHRVTLEALTVDSRNPEAAALRRIIVGDGLFRDRFESAQEESSPET